MTIYLVMPFSVSLRCCYYSSIRKNLFANLFHRRSWHMPTIKRNTTIKPHQIKLSPLLSARVLLFEYFQMLET
jgi:hypothetical protein